MELILWRHADAEPHDADKPDEARELTAKGQKQARKMAEWLQRHLPEDCEILSSPAVRTVQTAEALDRKFSKDPALASGSSAEAILKAANWPDNNKPIMIVGHQPLLGQVAALVLSGSKQDWTIRKGAVFWISQKDSDDTDDTYIKVVMGPDLAGK